MLSPEEMIVWSSLLLLAPARLTVNPHLPPPSASLSVCEPATPNLPPSIHLEEGLEPIVRWTLAYSPTFRQQCRVLAATPALTATITVVTRTAGDSDRARAVFRHYDSGAFIAVIEIRSTSELSELLAHEFEHLIEQLEGADLPALAKRGEAQRGRDGVFETRRAISAGRRVAGEVFDNAPDRIRGVPKAVWRGLRRLFSNGNARKPQGAISRQITESLLDRDVLASKN
jgi:hypothetical protein